MTPGRNHRPGYDAAAFERVDERDDREFYRVDRLVPHLDAVALEAVEHVIASLLGDAPSEILDLMASWDSHLADSIRTGRVVGLGLNPRELAANQALDGRIIHDLNLEPRLPFADDCFDAVLCTVSVDYLIRPFEVFGEVARVLRPGGLCLVIFSNRYFPDKVVRRWREASETERVLIVEDYLRACPGLGGPWRWVSEGRPRPEGDRCAGLGVPSDPVYAVWSEKLGGDRVERPVPPSLDPPVIDPARVARLKADVGRTLRCPYCGGRLSKWAVPQTPFTEWDEEFMYVCFNDRCPYLVRGWDAMRRQGIVGVSYRLMYNPGSDRCLPVPVPSLRALRDGIVEDRDEP